MNYFHAGWEHIAGHQACLAHILRDYQDAAETYPDAHLAGPGAAGAARPDPRLARRPRRRPARDPRRRRGPADPGVPPRRHRRPGRRPPHPRPEAHHRPAPRPRPARILPRPAKTTCSGSPPTPAIWPTNNISERGVRPTEDPAEDLRPAHQRRRHPGPARHPQLHRHRPQARPPRPRRPAQPVHREPLAAAGTRPGLTSHPALPEPRHTTHIKNHPHRPGECLRPGWTGRSRVSLGSWWPRVKCLID